MTGNGHTAPPLNVAVVGLGYWGPHYARILTDLPETHLAWACDQSEDRLELARRRYPWARFTADLDEVLSDPDVDAVVVATPTRTHSALVQTCLQAGKDVLVEKPLAASVKECGEIAQVVGDSVLMVGHTFVYNGGIVAMRDLVREGELGRVHYAKSIRAGLGPIREDVNVLWDLGPHDISILLELIPTPPIMVTATGQAFLRDHLDDVVFLTIRFEDGIIGHAHLSWLDPFKVRSITVVGDRRMAVFDDVASDERLKILDRGASYSEPSEESRGRGYGEFRTVLRNGDIHIPHLSLTEPLLVQVREFAEAMRERRAPYSDLAKGSEVVAVLEAAQNSLDVDGIPVPVGDYVRSGELPSGVSR
jgi:predicted dehydrogenase